MTMTVDMLDLAGRALTASDNWAKPLARALGAYHPDGPRETIDPRSVSRWRTGEMEVLPWAAAAIPSILRDHAEKLDDKLVSLSREVARMSDQIDMLTEAADEIERRLEGPPGPR